MNSTIHRRLAIGGLTLLTGAAIALAPAPASATTTASAGATSDQAQSVATPHRHRWFRYDDYDSRRECVRAGWRGERRGWWRDWRCVRDRDHDNDNNWRRHHQDNDWVLYVRRGWH